MLVTLPAASYSFVSSPMYQTLPCLSCAYQSNVASMTLPRVVSRSRITLAVTPMICLVWPVTVYVSTVGSPSLTPTDTHERPFTSGNQGLSIVGTKSPAAVAGQPGATAMSPGAGEATPTDGEAAEEVRSEGVREGEGAPPGEPQAMRNAARPNTVMLKART